jgi:hypothetical protein
VVWSGGRDSRVPGLRGVATATVCLGAPGSHGTAVVSVLQSYAMTVLSLSLHWISGSMAGLWMVAQ